jgi:hypothetical protein
MKNYIYLFLLLFLGDNQASELKERDTIRNNAANLFLSKQFSVLNKLVLTYIETEEKTSSGVWKLSYVYDGVSKLTRVKMTIEKRKKLEELAMEYIEKYPDLSISYLVYTDMLINHAWMFKKDFYSYRIKNHKEYYIQISKAKRILNYDINNFVRDPHWYELMLIIAREEKWSKGEYSQFLDQAIKQFPDYLHIYFAAVDYLLPNPFHHHTEFFQNDGDKKNHENEIDQLAIRAVEETKSLYKKGMYARIHWYVLSKCSLNKPLFKKSKVNWEQMKVSLRDVIQQYPVQWNINNYARYACLAADPVATHQLINQIKGEPIMLAWQEKSFFERCKTWAELIINEE